MGNGTGDVGRGTPRDLLDGNATTFLINERLCRAGRQEINERLRNPAL